MDDLWTFHAYVFTKHKDGALVYERTFSAACLTDAWRWIRKSGRQGCVYVNCVPKNWFY